jgi:hypothetical protein
MTELIDTLRSELVARIEELEPQIRELERLKEALDALNGTPARRAAAAKAEDDGDTPVAYVRGVRQRQALTAITRRPGMYTQELAEELDLEPGLIYAPVRRLVNAGLVVKRDFRLYPA